jgi:hypothetical protein
MDRVAQKMLSYFFLKKTAQIKQSRQGRKFRQSGHPASGFYNTSAATLPYLCECSAGFLQKDKLSFVSERTMYAKECFTSSCSDVDRVTRLGEFYPSLLGDYLLWAVFRKLQKKNYRKNYHLMIQSIPTRLPD